MSQAEQLAAYLKSGHSLTVAEALTLFGVYALSQRLGQLRREGFPVESEWVKTPSGKRVKRYRWKV